MHVTRSPAQERPPPPHPTTPGELAPPFLRSQRDSPCFVPNFQTSPECSSLAEPTSYLEPSLQDSQEMWLPPFWPW